ncbi:MAG TPA: Hsp20/alpha crystallin family protein [Candidatus Norongarragalinales archaeon]|nr:Hsp20/alpha crystallin family protein [Candidatus Norongarragalinales archaeon]
MKGKRYFDTMRFWFDFDTPMPKKMERFWEEFSRPFIDSFETESEIVITAELPGIKKEDVKLKVDENGLSIKVEEKSRREEEKKEGGFHYRKYSARFKGYGEYIPFSTQADAEKAKATFKNGVLEVRIPKTAKPKGRELRVE